MEVPFREKGSIKEQEWAALQAFQSVPFLRTEQVEH